MSKFKTRAPTPPSDLERIEGPKWRKECPPSVEGPKWRKECPPSVVLFATDGRGTVSVIDHQGPDAAYILEDSINAEILVTELARHPFPGLWVWEGKVHGRRDYWGEYDEEYVGDVRPLTEDEARAIRENDYVWDPKLWREE